MRGTRWLLPLLLISFIATVEGKSTMQQTKAPLMQDQIRELVPLMPDAALAGEINERGINFPITEEIINYLKRVSAGPQTIKALYSFILNRPPSVTSSLDKLEIQQGDTLTIYAKADDPDGDHLQYYWTSSAGNLSGKGTMARLDTSEIDTSNGAANVTVSLTVIDRKGGSDSFIRSVKVQRKVAAIPSNTIPERRPIIQRVRKEEAWMEDKHTIIHFEEGGLAPNGSWGFIEISALVSNGRASIGSISGMLPGIPCRVDLLPRENVSEMSFKEPPGTRNDWRKILIRVRPKDSNRIIRLAVYWQTLEQRFAR